MCVCVCLCVCDDCNALYRADMQGDVKTQPGAQSVFDQVSTDFGGVHHVIATMRDRKIWWQVKIITG